MWPFNRSLESVLNKTKTVRIHGVKFKIKKIDPSDYLDGSKVMTQLYDVYKTNKNLPSENVESILTKVKHHYKDVFLSAVVSPQLTRKKDDSGLFVDNLFTEWDLAHELYVEIMAFTYGKKKTP
jgi:hypothetical protein